MHAMKGQLGENCGSLSQNVHLKGSLLYENLFLLSYFMHSLPQESSLNEREYENQIHFAVWCKLFQSSFQSSDA